MPTPPIDAETLRQTLDLVQRHGSIYAAAKASGIPRQTIQSRVKKAADLGVSVDAPSEKPRVRVKAGSEYGFSLVKPLPSPHATAAEILARRKAEFTRVDEAKRARKLIDVAIHLDGPIGIAHQGDPHLDDPGTNIALVERHVELVNRTPGLFAANIGDLHNNWVGRLARLYGEQSTSAREAWQLVEWFVNAQRFLYLCGGNHDAWTGAGDPLAWMLRNHDGAFEYNGTRINLIFPNGRNVRINARHDFKGSSQWNPAHGVAKAAQLGWRDQILVAGHLHISGYNILKDPSSGLISHAIRVASYKTHDRYADQLGLPDQNISECVVTVIDPDASEERRLVTVFMDPEDAAEYLTWKRTKWAAAKRAS